MISIDDDDAAAAADRGCISSELSNEDRLLLLGDREFVLVVLSVLPFIREMARIDDNDGDGRWQ